MLPASSLLLFVVAVARFASVTSVNSVQVTFSVCDLVGAEAPAATIKVRFPHSATECDTGISSIARGGTYTFSCATTVQHPRSISIKLASNNGICIDDLVVNGLDMAFPEPSVWLDGDCDAPSPCYTDYYTWEAPPPTSAPTAAALPTDWLQVRARDLGATEEEVLRFRKWEHVRALEEGATVQQALLFESWEQVEAMVNGAEAQSALQVTTWEQTQALKFGAPIELALQFTTWEQQEALQLGATPEQALQFTTYEQTRLLKKGKSVAEALQA